MELEAKVIREKPEKFFINVLTPKWMFKGANSKAHRLEISRSEYVRKLIEKDLLEDEKFEPNN